MEEERELDALRALATEASPASSGGEHVDDAALARLRRDEDADTAADAAAARHVASCAACRARLLATDEERARAESLVGSHAPVARARAPAPVTGLDEARASRRSARRFYGAVAAATLAAAAAIALVPRSEDDLVVTQRAVVGMMGGDASAAVPAQDHDIEVSVRAAADAGRLVVIDARGKALARPQRMARMGEHLVGTVAPRALGPHVAPPRAVVLVGNEEGVTRAAAELEAALARGTVSDVAAVTAAAREAAGRHGARAATATLESPAVPGRIR